jgi:hypothetical protein
VTHFVRNRALDHRDAHDALTRRLDGFANRLGNLGCLTDGKSDLTLAIADYDERAKTETLAALDHLGDSIDADDRFVETAVVAIATSILH